MSKEDVNFAGTFAGPPFNPNISSVVSRKVQPVTSCSQIKISVTVASSDLTVAPLLKQRIIRTLSWISTPKASILFQEIDKEEIQIIRLSIITKIIS
ncbi:hypothetical protein RIR_jg36965.t1 [Rhizophagus irregularis DAOM 181602=DAOM 197198]|nr:hypothetical protein RIR_jg36965.t1 [Rhizophagus irregularis DAOM 181602=DAOM 197198]